MAFFRATSKFVVVEPSSGPRISYSSDFLDESEFISICPNPEKERREDEQRARAKTKTKAKATEFEFLSGNLTNMLSADELFCEGKLRSFWQVNQPDKLNMIALKPENNTSETMGPHWVKQQMIDKEENRINWFIEDNDPSPRPPRCTVLWKEVLRMKKQRGSSMTPPSTSSIPSSERKERVIVREKNEEKCSNNDKRVNKKVGERRRRRRRGIRIRPVINFPIRSQARKK